MSDFSFQFYPGDVLRQTRFFTQNQKGFYLDILSVHIENIRFSYDFIMKIISTLSDEEKNDFMRIFTKDSEGYYIDWCATAIEKRAKYIESRSKNKEGKTKNHMKNISKSYGKQKQNRKQILKINTENKNELKTILEIFNEKTNSNYKSYRAIEENYNHWRNQYSMEEIIQAIEKIPSNQFWSDKMTPVILFRQKDQNKEPVDHIGMLINFKSSTTLRKNHRSETSFVYPISN